MHKIPDERDAIGHRIKVVKPTAAHDNNFTQLERVLDVWLRVGEIWKELQVVITVLKEVGEDLHLSLKEQQLVRIEAVPRWNRRWPGG